MFSTKLTVLLFTLVIYVLILTVFNKARVKYAGGKIGSVVNLVLVTVVFLFIADYAMLFEERLSPNFIFTAQSLFRATGLGFLAYGGLRIVAD